MFGPPGSGKGTQAELLSNRSGWPTISVGDLLRKERREGTELGKTMGEIMDRGELVPEEIAIQLIQERLNEADAQIGVILDGYPRNVEELDDLLALVKKGDMIQLILLDVKDEDILDRTATRLICASCGAKYNTKYCPPKQANVCDRCNGALIIRSDDKPEVVNKRLNDYHQAVAEMLKATYKAHYTINIDGGQSIEKVEADIWEAIERNIKDQAES
jgi:adenylate kinase